MIFCGRRQTTSDIDHQGVSLSFASNGFGRIVLLGAGIRDMGQVFTGNRQTVEPQHE